MADPITLTGAAVWFLSTKAADWFVGGPLGNFGADAVKALYKKSRLIWEQGKIPENEDLIKALHTARHNATEEMLKIACIYVAPIDSNEAARLKEAAVCWLKEDKEFIHGMPLTYQDDKMYNQVEYIFAGGDSDSLTEKRTAIATLVKKEFWNHLNYGLGKYEYSNSIYIEQLLFNGWKINDKPFDWFELVILYLGDILKSENHPLAAKAKTAFHLRLLSDIKVSQDEIETAITILSEKLEILFQDHKLIYDGIVQLQPAITRIAGFIAPQPNLVFDFRQYSFTNESLFKARGNNLLGRSREMNQLLEFCYLRDSVSWWVITGDLGSGKSRLAMELCFRLPETMLKGFMLAEELIIFNWQTWEPQAPALIIIDDASAFVDKIVEVIKIIYKRKNDLTHHVKFLLIDRNINGEWWENMNKNINAGNLPDTWQSPLKLNGLEKDNIWRIFSAIFQKRGSSLPDQDETLKTFYKIDPDGKPLFAVFAAESLAAGENIRGWNKNRLLQKELDRQEVNIWKPSCGNNLELLRKFKLLAALSTLCSGLDKHAIRKLLNRNLDWLPNKRDLEYHSDIYKGFGLIEYNNGSVVFKPMEPDTLGEYFVLRELNKEKAGLFNECIGELVEIAWELNPARTAFTVDCSFWDFKEFDYAEFLLVTPPPGASADHKEYWLRTASSVTSLCAQNKWFDKAEQLIEQIILIAEKGVLNAEFYISKASAELCTFYFADKQYEKAEKYLQVIWSLCQKGRTNCYIHYAKVICNKGIIGAAEKNSLQVTKSYKEIVDFNDRHIRQILIRQINDLNRLMKDSCLSRGLPIPDEYLQDILPGSSMSLDELMTLESTKARNAGKFFSSTNAHALEVRDFHAAYELVLQKNLDEFLILEAEAAKSVIRTFAENKLFDEIQPYISNLMNLARLQIPKIRIILTSALGVHIFYLLEDGRLDSAEDIYATLCGKCDVAIPDTFEYRVIAAYNLIRTLCLRQEFDRCEKYLSDIKFINPLIGNFIAEKYAESLQNLIHYSSEAGKFDLAEIYLKDTELIRADYLPAKLSFVGHGLLNLFLTYHRTGNLTKAAAFRERIRDLRKIAGDVVAVQHTHMLYKTFFYSLNQHQLTAAIHIYDESKINSHVLDAENLDMLCTMIIKLLEIHSGNDDMKEALKYYRELRSMAAVGAKRGMENIVIAGNNLSSSLTKVEDLDLLLSFYNDMGKYAKILNTPEALCMHSHLAYKICTIYSYAGRFDESEPFLNDMKKLAVMYNPAIYIDLMKGTWNLFTQAYGAQDIRWKKYFDDSLYAAYFIRHEETAQDVLDHMRPTVAMFGLDLDNYFTYVTKQHMSQVTDEIFKKNRTN